MQAGLHLVTEFETQKYEPAPTAFILKIRNHCFRYTRVGKAGGDVEMKVAGPSTHSNGPNSVCSCPGLPRIGFVCSYSS